MECEKKIVALIHPCNIPFTIKLKSNMTTGYQWLVEYDKKMVKLNNSEYIASTPSRCGSGGHQIFDFTGLQEGNTQILFRYQRIWEPEPIKREIYEISLLK